MLIRGDTTSKETGEGGMMPECPLVEWTEKKIAEALAMHNCNYHSNEDSTACSRMRALGTIERQERERASETCGRVV
jgi:hypothetical protein